MDINGKWRLVSADNIREICDVVGTTVEDKEKAVKLMSAENNVTQDITVNGDDVSIVYTIPDRTITVKTKLGQPAEMPFFDGRMLQCVFGVEDDKLVEKQTGAFHAVNIRYREGSKLIMKMTSKNVTTTRVYERI